LTTFHDKKDAEHSITSIASQGAGDIPEDSGNLIVGGLLGFLAYA